MEQKKKYLSQYITEYKTEYRKYTDLGETKKILGSAIKEDEIKLKGVEKLRLENGITRLQSSDKSFELIDITDRDPNRDLFKGINSRIELINEALRYKNEKEQEVESSKRTNLDGLNGKAEGYKRNQDIQLMGKQAEIQEIEQKYVLDVDAEIGKSDEYIKELERQVEIHQSEIEKLNTVVKTNRINELTEHKEIEKIKSIDIQSSEIKEKYKEIGVDEYFFKGNINLYKRVLGNKIVNKIQETVDVKVKTNSSLLVEVDKVKDSSMNKKVIGVPLEALEKMLPIAKIALIVLAAIFGIIIGLRLVTAILVSILMNGALRTILILGILIVPSIWIHRAKRNPAMIIGYVIGSSIGMGLVFTGIVLLDEFLIDLLLFVQSAIFGSFGINILLVVMVCLVLYGIQYGIAVKYCYKYCLYLKSMDNQIEACRQEVKELEDRIEQSYKDELNQEIACIEKLINEEIEQIESIKANRYKEIKAEQRSVEAKIKDKKMELNSELEVAKAALAHTIEQQKNDLANHNKQVDRDKNNLLKNVQNELDKIANNYEDIKNGHQDNIIGSYNAYITAIKDKLAKDNEEEENLTRELEDSRSKLATLQKIMEDHDNIPEPNISNEIYPKFLLGFAQADNDCPAELLAIEHGNRPIVLFYKGSDFKGQKTNIRNTATKMVMNLVKNISKLNSNKISKQHLITRDAGAAFTQYSSYFIDLEGNDLASSSIDNIVKADKETVNLLKQLKVENILVANSNKTEAVGNKLGFNGSSSKKEEYKIQIPYNICIFFQYDSQFLENDEIQIVLSNTEITGILPIIFIDEEELDHVKYEDRKKYIKLFEIMTGGNERNNTYKCNFKLETIKEFERFDEFMREYEKAVG